MIYDVLIVGAGPSGGYLGYILSKQGVKVKIIDKENFPRDKVCGGGISNKTVELLDFDISSIVQKKIIGAVIPHAGYMFSGSLIPISEYDFLSKALKTVRAFCWKTLPVPLPYDYLTGFDAQLAISEGNNPFYIGYLMVHFFSI